MTEAMPAVRKVQDGPGNVELCEVPVPDIGPDEVLMKVYAAGICGSDLLIQEDRHFYRSPVTQGHEFSGVAYKVGRNVTRVAEGDKFVADIECGEGDWLGVTIDGAFAPYMRVPEHVIYRISEGVNIEHAAMTELITATHHLIQERAQVRVGDDVVIVGPGPMGIVATQYAKICGAQAGDPGRPQERRETAADWPPSRRRRHPLLRRQSRRSRYGAHERQGCGICARMLGQRARRTARDRLRCARRMKDPAARASSSSSACGARKSPSISTK